MSENHHEEMPSNTHERVSSYEASPITMGTLGMWVPILLTTVSLIIAIMGGVSSVSVSNASKISRLETEVEHLKEEINRLQADVRSTQYNVERRNEPPSSR